MAEFGSYARICCLFQDGRNLRSSGSQESAKFWNQESAKFWNQKSAEFGNLVKY
jgi:hypothetical protein